MSDNSRETAVKDTFPSTVHRFKEGQSGNPDGRPVGAVSVKAELRKLMDIILEGEDNPLTQLPENMPAGRKVALNLAMKAIADGDLGAIRTIIDHLDGKPSESLEIAGKGGGPIQMQVGWMETSETE
jgi:hypothetical protein